MILVSDKVNSSAVLTPALNGFQLLGIAPGAATSEVLTTPDNLLIIVLLVASLSVRLPAIKRLPNDSIIPQLTFTTFLDSTVTVTVSPIVNPPITTTVVLVAVSVYISN